jgi:hypothetical protein
MSKKLPEHKRLFKLWKAGFFNKIEMTYDQKQMLKYHYPFIFEESQTENNELPIEQELISEI